jgi:hypothetical protein
MPVKEGWQAQRAEEIEMLRDMLGVDTNGSPYR